jgi:hypothetical protein
LQASQSEKFQRKRIENKTPRRPSEASSFKSPSPFDYLEMYDSSQQVVTARFVGFFLGSKNGRERTVIKQSLYFSFLETW